MRNRLYCKSSTCRNWGKLNEDQYCPKCASEEQATDNNSNCAICQSEVEGSDLNVIGCDLCENWYHSKCVGCPEELIKIMNSLNDSLDDTMVKLLGNLLWVCPKCNDSSPKTVRIIENSCEIINTPAVNHKGCSANASDAPICKDYRYGKCQNGENCVYGHPAKCLEYCRYGREGCSGGFAKCKLLHPVLCRNSLRYNKCLDQSCTLAHLKGTIRKEEGFTRKILPKQRYDHRSSHHNKGNTSYSTYNPNKLGFLNYRQTLKENRNHSSHPQNPGQNRYQHNSQDYPDLTCQDTQYFSKQDQSSTIPNTDQPLFLEMIQQLKSVQEAQFYFQQELMSLRSSIAPLAPRHPSHSFPNHNNQQQLPVIQSQTSQ